MSTRPSIDHSLLSPSGRVSKRAEKAAKERARRALFGDGLPAPTTPQPSDAERYLRQAKELRDLAARGMHPRKYIAKAEELERKARGENPHRWRKPANAVTWQALRQRASKIMPRSERKHCVYCGARNPRTIDHVDGDERNTVPENLVPACQSCNGVKGKLFARLNIGRRVDAFNRDRNPARAGEHRGAKSWRQWVMAVTALRYGSADMTPQQAVAIVKATPAADRSRFARRIWEERRRRGTDTWATSFKFENPAMKTKSSYDSKKCVFSKKCTCLCCDNSHVKDVHGMHHCKAECGAAFCKAHQNKLVRGLCPNCRKERKAAAGAKENPRKKNSSVPLLKLTDVYGDTHYVAKADWEKQRTQTPLRFKTGAKLSDSPIKSVRQGATTIHRDNVREVVPFRENPRKKPRAKARKRNAAGPGAPIPKQLRDFALKHKLPLVQQWSMDGRNRTFYLRDPETGKAASRVVTKPSAAMAIMRAAAKPARKNPRRRNAADIVMHNGEGIRAFTPASEAGRKFLAENYAVRPDGSASIDADRVSGFRKKAAAAGVTIAASARRRNALHAAAGKALAAIGKAFVSAASGKAKRKNTASPVQEIGPGEYQVSNGRGATIRLIRKPWGWETNTDNKASRAWHGGRAFMGTRTFRNLKEVESAYKALRGIAQLIEDPHAKRNPKGGLTKAQIAQLDSDVQWLSGKLADPNGAKDDRAPAWREELRVKRAALLAAIGAKKNPAKRPTRRRNSNGSEREAAAAYQMFHGKPSTKMTELVQEIRGHKDYAQLGDLVLLRVKAPGGKFEIGFQQSDKVMLCCDPKRRQLYFIGGNQQLPETVLRQEGLDTSKDMLDLGELTHVEYHTRKRFDDFKPITYFHELGEETGERPRLIYDKLNKQLHLVGGAYQIKPEGIVN